MPTFLRLLALVAVLLFAGGSAARAADPVSTFDAGPDGWTSPASYAIPAPWAPTGGNPGGYLLPNMYVGANAPAAFLGDQSRFLAGELVLDVRRTSDYDSLDLYLRSGPDLYAHDIEMASGPIGVWSEQRIPLTGARWMLTEAQMAQVLGNVTLFNVHLSPNVGIDNVRFVTRSAPATKEDCANGGYATYAFKNQGQCIKSLKG